MGISGPAPVAHPRHGKQSAGTSTGDSAMQEVLVPVNGSATSQSVISPYAWAQNVSCWVASARTPCCTGSATRSPARCWNTPRCRWKLLPAQRVHAGSAGDCQPGRWVLAACCCSLWTESCGRWPRVFLARGLRPWRALPGAGNPASRTPCTTRHSTPIGHRAAVRPSPGRPCATSRTPASAP